MKHSQTIPSNAIEMKTKCRCWSPSMPRMEIPKHEMIAIMQQIHRQKRKINVSEWHHLKCNQIDRNDRCSVGTQLVHLTRCWAHDIFTTRSVGALWNRVKTLNSWVIVIVIVVSCVFTTQTTPQLFALNACCHYDVDFMNLRTCAAPVWRTSNQTFTVSPALTHTHRYTQTHIQTPKHSIDSVQDDDQRRDFCFY